MLRGEIPRVLADAAATHGDVVRFELGPTAGHHVLHLIAAPEGAKHVLQDNQANYRKAFTYEALKMALGRGLLTAEGEHWKRHRRLVQPSFARRQIGGFADLMIESAEATGDRWKTAADSGQTLDIGAEMTRLTLGVVSRSLFSTDLSEEAASVGRALGVVQEHAMQRLLSPLGPVSIRLDALPTPSSRRFKAALAQLDDLVYRLIAERRRECAGEAGSGDLLARLMATTDEETGESLSDAELRDEVITFLLAGHETTANALAWTWYLLSADPEAERRLRTELDEVLGGRAPTADEADRLPYTSAVVAEAMRLYPPAWTIEREPLADDEIGGYAIPANSTVMVPPFVIHRRSGVWANPEGFDPQRFLGEGAAEIDKFAYFPFGGGRRVCIGREFALIEATLILASLARRYRFELAPAHRMALDPKITLRPANGVVGTVHHAEEHR
jgi:cytochrome P450